eukprot:7419686-Alexandrium_andersonii.AAC.1
MEGRAGKPAGRALQQPRRHPKHLTPCRGRFVYSIKSTAIDTYTAFRGERCLIGALDRPFS